MRLCKCQFHLLVILCNRTSLSERLGHVIRSSLGQTSALHFFPLTTLLIPLCMIRGTLNGLSFVKDLTENQRDRTLRTLVNQGYGNTNFRIVNRTVSSGSLVDL